MPSFAYPVFNQIKLLVSNLTKKNLKATSLELRELIRLFGDDTRLFLLCCLFEEIDFFANNPSKDAQRLELLNQEISVISKRPNFSSMICRALEQCKVKTSTGFFAQFFKTLNLPFTQRVLVSLGLAQSVTVSVKTAGVEFLKQLLPDLTSFNADKISIPVLHELLFFIRITDTFSQEEKRGYIQKFEQLYPQAFKELSIVPLSSSPSKPVTADNFKSALASIASSSDLAKVIHDVRHIATASRDNLSAVLQHFPSASVDDLARVVSAVVRTQHTTPSESLPLLNVLSMATSGSYKLSGAEEKSSVGKWDPEILVNGLKERYPSVSFADVFSHLDIDEFFVPTKASFDLLLDIYKAACPERPFPLGNFVGQWKNARGQLSVLIRFIVDGTHYPASNFTSFLSLSRTTAPLEGIIVPSHADPKSVILHYLHQYHAWFSVEFIESLLNKSQTNLHHLVRRLFSQPLEQCPEVLLCGLVACDVSGNAIHEELLGMLMPKYILHHPNSKVVLNRLWSVKSELVVTWMVKMYLEDRSVLHRVFEIATSLKDALSVVLEARSFAFSIDLAVLAASRKNIKLENWLQLRLHEHGNPFAKECLVYLSDIVARIVQDAKKPKPDNAEPTNQLHIPSKKLVIEFFQILLKNASLMSPDLYQQVQQMHSNLPFSDSPGDNVDVDIVEKRANEIFQLIYTEKLPLSDVVELLKRFKNSSMQEQKEIYACMIHNLFDEYRFFNKYPQKELRITGILFGLLIQHQLVSAFTLGIALRYVLEALRKTPGGKVFQFGMWALEQFKGRLHQWPQYCSLMLQIEHLRQADPELIVFLEDILNGNGDNSSSTTDSAARAKPSGPPPGLSKSLAPGMGSLSISDDSSASRVLSRTAPNTPAKPVQKTERKAETPGRMNSGNRQPRLQTASMSLDTLSQEAVIAMPPEEIEDKIHWIVNNVSKTNFRTKAKEMKEALPEEYFPYFARYLVVKRLALENNNHKMYANFLDAIGNPKLSEAITEATFNNLKLLLASDKVLQSSSDRSLVKHLGSWLGMRTIARDKPLLAKKLNLKKLIVDAYDKGRFIAVIPFAAKVLETCGKSTVFKPPNPWLMGLLRLLREIFDLPKLPLNLKFEIEVLATHLNIKMKDIKASSLLADRAPGQALNSSSTRSSPAISSARGSKNNSARPSPDLRPLEPTGDSMMKTPPITASSPGPASSTTTPSVASGQFSEGTVPQIIINPSIALFNMTPALKRLVPTAIDRAIREIISPVVERSVTIACVTTRELILKDFAFEKDETKMQAAAHAMVQNLTSSLALVTCKEPLRVSISNHLGTLLEQSINVGGPSEHSTISLIEKASGKISTDNLELGCAVIEKAAAERAIREIDDALASEYNLRRKYREQEQYGFPSSPFQSNNPPPNRMVELLPEPLRPRSSGLTASQLNVYDEFKNMRIQVPRTPQGQPEQEAKMQDPARSSSGPSPQQPAQGNAAPQGQTDAMLAEQMFTLVNQLQEAVMRFPNAHEVPLNLVDRDHEITHIVGALHGVLSSVPSTTEGTQILAALAQKVFAQLYDLGKNNQPKQGRFRLMEETLTAVLKLTRIKDSSISKDITNMLMYFYSAHSHTPPGHNQVAYDDRPWALHRDVSTTMIRAGLVHLPDWDLHVAKAVQLCVLESLSKMNATLNSVEFAILMIQQLVIKESIFSHTDFPHTLTQLSEAARHNNMLAKPIKTLMDEIRAKAANGNSGKGNSTPPDGKSLPTLDAKASHAIPAEHTFHELERQMQMDIEREPQGLRQQIMFLLEEWLRIYLPGSASDKTYAHYLSILKQRGVLSSAENTRRFFRIITELCMEVAFTGYSQSGQQSEQAGSYIDALSKLIVFLVKFLDPVPAQQGQTQANAIQQQQQNKILLLDMFLKVSSYVLHRECARKTDQFNQRPWLRLYSNLLQDLNTPDPNLDSSNVAVLVAFASCFHLLCPPRVPAFTFAWLELIAHRMFMPKLLINKHTPQCPHLFQQLLIDLFSFMEPYLRHAELSESVRLLYKGALRILLVLLHDFPEFLCDYHFSLCEHVPLTCIQMRNLILSAFPHSMRLPDPFMPNLKVDLLPEISQPPRILSDVSAALQSVVSRQSSQPVNIQAALDSYLSKRGPPSFLQDFVDYMYLPAHEAKRAGTPYNVPVINSLVVHVGIQGIAQLHENKGMTHFQTNGYMDIYEALLVKLQPEGRYLLLNAITNQLRYPNNHTHYFSCLLLYLFSTCKEDVIKEQITRVLLERLIVHRPHPWGLLVTFIELIKNPRYQFWQQPFTRCAPEIERLFESVARSCMPATSPSTQQGAAQHSERSNNPQ